MSVGICKFYGTVNNILSVAGYKKNEIAIAHKVKTYMFHHHCVDVKFGILAQRISIK